MQMVVTSVADVRKEPRSNSELDSQLIYGETVEVVEELGEFSHIVRKNDVEGFVKTSLLGEYSTRKYKLSKQYRNRIMALPFGAYLSEEDIEKFSIPRSFLVDMEKKFNPVDLANRFMGIPYLWGGTSDFGFDCSGFTQRLFRYSGYEIPRNSDQQRDASLNVEGFEDAKKGDLVFFKGHVAFYVGRGKIIHANGHYSRITINDLTDESPYSRSLLKIMEKIGRFPLH
ncbi:MAG: C40 family peptidase [Thermoplasmata archaeon]